MEGWTDISSESLMGQIKSLPYDELSMLFSELITNLGFEILDIHADKESLKIVAKSRLGDSYFIKVRDSFDKEEARKAVEEAGTNSKAVLVALSKIVNEEIKSEILELNVEFIHLEKLIELAKGYDVKSAIERLITSKDSDIKKIETESINAEITSEVSVKETQKEDLKTKEISIEEKYAQLSQLEKEEFINKLIEEAKTDFNSGNKENAYRNYQAVLKFEPKNIEALQGAADSLLSLEKYDEAVVFYDKLLEVEPNNVSAWYDKGVALGHLGKYEEEIECYRAVLKIMPDNPKAENNLGVALQMIERTKRLLRYTMR
jgi:tetratricopeptide (TPR) repeat protein